MTAHGERREEREIEEQGEEVVEGVRRAGDPLGLIEVPVV
jgi:hypothetical protein